MGGVREVARDATDEPARLGAVGLEQHRRHTGRGCLAVRARDDDVTAFVQQTGAQQFGKRDVGLGAGFKQPFHFGMSARGDVTDDDEVGLELGQAFGGPAFKNIDAGAA